MLGVNIGIDIGLAIEVEPPVFKQCSHFLEQAEINIDSPQPNPYRSCAEIRWSLVHVNVIKYLLEILLPFPPARLILYRHE